MAVGVRQWGRPARPARTATVALPRRSRHTIAVPSAVGPRQVRRLSTRNLDRCTRSIDAPVGTHFRLLPIRIANCTARPMHEAPANSGPWPRSVTILSSPFKSRSSPTLPTRANNPMARHQQRPEQLLFNYSRPLEGKDDEPSERRRITGARIDSSHYGPEARRLRGLQDGNLRKTCTSLRPPASIAWNTRCGRPGAT